MRVKTNSGMLTNPNNRLKNNRKSPEELYFFGTFYVTIKEVVKVKLFYE